MDILYAIISFLSNYGFYSEIEPYLNLVIWLIYCIGLSGCLAVLAYAIAITQLADTDAKREGYECGFAPFSDARFPITIQFCLVGILFLIFDLEILLLLPWLFTFTSILDVFLVPSMLVFLVLIGCGFIYEWRMGVLVWHRRPRSRK